MRAIDVAECILRQHQIKTCHSSRLGSIGMLKLQKLLYYAQAWSIVWDDCPLFVEDIEAWRHGPFVPKVYEKNVGEYYVWTVGGCDCGFKKSAKETINAVIEYYGKKSTVWLADLSRMEDPWKIARSKADESNPTPVISLASMAEYYSSLDRYTAVREELQKARNRATGNPFE